MTTEERKAIWIASAQDVFPDMWEIQANTLVIYFPEIVIKNSLDLEHTITDLFVRFKFDDFFVAKGTLEGKRITLSIREFLNGYGHSHLCPPGVAWNDFCLGHDAFSNQMRYFSELCYQDLDSKKISDLSEIDVLGALLNLSSYIGWESLEGGPHRKIEDLSDWNYAFKTNYNYFSNPYKLEDKHVNYHYLKALPLINDLKIAPHGLSSNILFKITNDLDTLLDSISEIKALKKTDRIIKANPDEIIKDYLKNTIGDISISPLQFKGKEFPFRITDLESFNFKDVDFGMPKLLKKTIINKLNEQLNKTAKRYFLTS